MAVIGITTPGNKTVFLNGKIGIESGKSSFFRASSSSVVNNGINSASDSTSLSDKLSNMLNFGLFINLFCQIVINTIVLKN